MNSMLKGESGRRVQYCKKCLTPDTRPRVVFSEKCICNACENAEEKENINWEERRKEFLNLIAPYRSQNGEWDCLVPWSGGKDSSTIAYKLKYEFGLNPLLVTFSPMIVNEVGEYNREQIIKLGFDHLFHRPNQKVQRRLGRRFFIERGNPKVCWEAGKEAFPIQTAVNHNIPLVFYAEHGESEYGGKVLNEKSRKLKDYTEVVEHLVGDDATNWIDDQITENDLNPYIYPAPEMIKEVGVKALYFSYFFRWSMYENYRFIKNKINFHTCPKGRTDGTFTDFDSIDDKMDNVYYYMQYIKFGFGRAVRDASRMIQNGHITRDQGLDYVLKYDHEFPNDYFDDVLEYLQVTKDEFMEIVDKHRNPEIWDKVNREWNLKFPPR